MGSFIFIILGVSLIFIEPDCQGQGFIRVSEPKMKRKDNLVYITYDFLNGQPTDTFNVTVDISDAFGNSIHESALSGDIGNDVMGGENKTIVWNLNVDRIYMEDDISVKILAQNRLPVPKSKLILISEIPLVEDNAEEGEAPTLSEEAPTVTEEAPTVTEEVPILSGEASVKNFSRSGIVIQSLVFPGLGLSRVKSKPHWLKGLAGYGCLAGSIVYKNKANEMRTEYNAAIEPDWKTFYYDVSVWQDNISKAFVAGAIVIWASDFIWTIAGTSELNKVQVYGDFTGISLGTGIEQTCFVPTVRLKCSF